MGRVALHNPRITPQERGLLKGSIRRCFSRSDLRQQVINASVIRGHTDRSRPRVKTWCKCAICGEAEAKSNMVVDHRLPIIPLNKSLTDMSWDDLINNLWCSKENLDAVCEPCHAAKTKEENAIRRKHKKELK